MCFNLNASSPTLGGMRRLTMLASSLVNQIKIQTFMPFAKVLNKDNTNGIAALMEAITPARASGEKASLSKWGSE